MTASNSVRTPASGSSAADRPSATKRRTEVVIVGAGDEILIEVGPALGDQYRTFNADSGADIPALTVTSWIGLYDATSRADSRSAFGQIEQQYGSQPWIILCTDEERAKWQPVLSRGSACAVVSRSELTPESLNAALEQAKQRLGNAAPAARASGASMQPKRVLIGAGAGAAVVIAGVVAWLVSHGHRAAPSVPVNHVTATARNAAVPTAAAPAVQAPNASVEDLLSQARVAFRDPNSQLPKADAPLQGTSALELYGAVLDQQPKNQEALDGVRRLQSVARVRVQNALQAGDVDTAARLLAVLQHSDIAPEELRTLANAVTAARPRQLASQARSAIAAGNLTSAHQYIDQLATLSGERSPVPELRKELDARQLDATLATSAQQVRAAISAGTLLEPANDNARTRFVAMRDLSRTNAQTLAVEHELLGALLRRVRTAIGRQDFDGAQQVLIAAQDFGTTAELADTRSALDAGITAKRSAEEASAAAARAARLSAPPVVAANAGVVLSPRPIRPLQIDFPKTALELNQKGYVVVDFMLNPDGSASALSVAESSPRKIFDNAALAAVKKATFSTHDLADAQKPQRSHIKINFSLSDSAAPATPATRAAEIAPPPAAATGAAAAPAAPAVARVLSPVPTRALQVEYPSAAMALRREGWVLVEFMLNPDGTASALTVVDSTPQKLFDREALAAIRGAKFATKDLDDPTKPQRARMKINFKLP